MFSEVIFESNKFTRNLNEIPVTANQLICDSAADKFEQGLVLLTGGTSQNRKRIFFLVYFHL